MFGKKFSPKRITINEEVIITRGRSGEVTLQTPNRFHKSFMADMAEILWIAQALKQAQKYASQKVGTDYTIMHVSAAGGRSEYWLVGKAATLTFIQLYEDELVPTAEALLSLTN